MNINKKILMKLIVIIIILIVVIYNIFLVKNDTEELIYSDILVNDTNDFSETIDNNISKIKVYVTGEVKLPGVIELDENSRIEDAISSAGGVTEFANLLQVNLAYHLEDGQKLYIPSINDIEEVEYLTKENGEKIVEGVNGSSGAKVNINKDDLETLKTLPGVGDSLAQRIINYRNENGKFNSVEELKNVSGIGDKKYESLVDYIDV